MAERTKTALMLLIIATFLSVVVNAAVMGTRNPDISSVAILPGIIALIGYILILLGRKEFSEKHERYVIGALITFLIGLIVVVIGSVAFGFALVSAVLSGTSTEGAIVWLYVAAVGGIIIGLARVLVVFQLEQQLGRALLIGSFIAATIVSVVVFAMSVSAFDAVLRDVQGIDPIALQERMLEFSGRIAFYQGLSLIGDGLFLLALWLAHDGIVKGRIKRRELLAAWPGHPVTPTPTSYAPAKAPPPYETTKAVTPPDKCPRCGSSLIKGARFCQVCGQSVS